MESPSSARSHSWPATTTPSVLSPSSQPQPWVIGQQRRRRPSEPRNPRQSPIVALVEIEDALIAFIRDERPVVWMGAGLSQDLSFPGWSQLLDRLCRECGVPRGDDSFTSLLEQAETCRRVAPDTYEAVIIEEFGEHARPTRSRWLHRYLIQLQLPAYVTTNYDHLLVREVRSPTAPECHVLRFPRMGDTPLHDPRPAIYHIHGLAGRDEGGNFNPIVLAKSDFVDAYGSELAPARAFVSHLLLQRSVLFLGVGKGLSEDVYIRDILQAVKAQHERWFDSGERVPRRLAVTTRKSGLDPADEVAKEREATTQTAGLKTLGIESLEVVLPTGRDGRPSYEEVDRVFDRVAKRMGLQRSVTYSTGLAFPGPAGGIGD